MAGLNETELLIDNISQRIEQLLIERKTLHKELFRQSNGSLEQEKSFVQIYQTAIYEKNNYHTKAAKLEYMLQMR